MATNPSKKSKSLDTRQKLLDAGLFLFGANGISGVSTRQLADCAGVNLSGILYHFGGKEQLYEAVAQQIADTTGAQIAATAAAIAPTLKELTREQAAMSAGSLLGRIARVILATPDAASRAGFILREQMQPSPAFDIIYHGYIERVHMLLAELVARALDRDANSEMVILQTHALLGQAMIFGMAKATILLRLGEHEFSESRVNRTVSAIEQITVKALSS